MSDDFQELDRLIEQLRENDLSAGEQDRLTGLLDENPNAQRRFAEHMAISSLLAEKTIAAPLYPVRSLSVQGTVTDRTGYSPFPAWKTILPWGIAAVLAVVLLTKEFVSPGPGSEPENESFLGLLVDEAGAEFQPGYEPDNVRFDSGEYRLQKGAIHLRLENGADVFMQSPVAFRIDDSFHFALHRGGLRAIVPPSALGFTVAAPGIDYEDLGTEFGIAVDPEFGASELHVFDGQVDAKKPGSKQLIESVTGGESVAFADGLLKPMAGPVEGRFLSPGAIGFLRWQSQRQAFRNDPGLLGYYPFIEADTLKNEAVNGVATDGQIEGARWVSGRWPGKSALLFDRDDDFVELEIPGDYEALTFATWVKLDRVDFNLTSLFHSNGWEHGDVHWLLTRSGWMSLTAHFIGKPEARTPQPTFPRGEWVHLAATISKADQTMAYYRNGTLVGSRVGRVESLAPGLGRIGNWLKSDSYSFPAKRSLRGRIDEFAIWKRVLTEKEIKNLTDEGKPDALWSTKTN